MCIRMDFEPRFTAMPSIGCNYFQFMTAIEGKK